MSSLSEQLTDFGLNSAQAMIYVLLLQKGELRIQEISTACGLPRSSVYNAIGVLENKGLVERIIGENFIKINAYPLDALRHNLQQEIKEREKLSKKLDKLENALINSDANVGDVAKVRYYRGVSGARQIFWNSLKARDTMLVYSAWGRSKYVGVRFYEEFVAKSKTAKIKEQVLINADHGKLKQIKTFEGSTTSRTLRKDIRVIENNLVKINGETLIYNNIYAVVYLKGRELNGFEIESQEFVKMQRSIYNTLWNGIKKPSQ